MGSRDTDPAFPLAHSSLPASPTEFDLPQCNGGAKDLLRVTRACDRCKRRKIRCTGTHPCGICTRLGAPCEYTAPNRRGRLPRAPRRGPNSLSMKSQSQPVSTGHDTVAIGQPRTSSSGIPIAPATSVPTTEPPSRASPDLPVTDLQGHYIGPASGVSFLHRVQQRLHLSDHSSPSFTFGDTPLPEFDPANSGVIISVEETSRLVQKFFEFSVPIDRIFHQPTIEAWLDEFHDTMGAMANTDEAPARRAVLWTVFATAQGHFNDMHSRNQQKSVYYFLMADYHLSKEKGAACLASVQARLFQCFWLLSQSRINHCWDLFGAASRHAITLGLHRRKFTSSVDESSWLELEYRRRTFWSAYCLDSYLSMALGRPRVFHEEDIDQELPSEIDGCAIGNPDSNLPLSSHGFSPMLVPVAYYKIYRIINVVLRALYSVRPVSTANRSALVLEYSQKLKSWREEVPSFATEENTGPLIALFQRQRDVLNLTYWHTIILVHRPLLLMDLVRASRRTGGDNDPSANWRQMQGSVEECLRASMRIVDTVARLSASGQMYRSFWGTTYYAFTAAVILYLYTIKQLVSSMDSYHEYFEAAVSCQKNLFKLVVKGSLTARYCVVLEELRIEAIRHIERPLNWPLTASGGAYNSDSDPNGSVEETLYGDMGTSNTLHIYESSLMGISNWAQFESLIVPGFGGFDTNTDSN